MNKREIVHKLNTDLTSAKALMEIIARGEKTSSLELLNRLDAQIGYISSLLEYINLQKKC